MTQRQPHHQKLNTAWVTTHKSWNPGDSLHGFQEAQHLTAYLTSGREELVKQLCFKNFMRLVHCPPPPQVLISEGIVP